MWLGRQTLIFLLKRKIFESPAAWWSAVFRRSKQVTTQAGRPSVFRPADINSTLNEVSEGTYFLSNAFWIIERDTDEAATALEEVNEGLPPLIARNHDSLRYSLYVSTKLFYCPWHSSFPPRHFVVEH